MAYQHLNRLQAHWGEFLAETKLSGDQRAIALVIASRINQETNHYHLSAKTLSKYTLSSPTTIYTATAKLEALGLFEITRAGKRSPKDFRLLLECPETCQARAIDHYTETELQERPERWNKAAPKQEQLNDYQTEYTNSRGTEYTNLESEYTNPRLTEYTNPRLTNKELIKKNKENINKNEFEILVISNALKDLAKSNQYTKEHELLQTALEGNRVEVLERAQEITKTATNPEPYLTQIIKTNPLSLLKKTSEQVHKAKHPRNLKSQYETYRENEPELISWTELGTSQTNFLERITGATLSLTAAHQASKATIRGIDLDTAKSSLEASEIISNPETNLDLAVAALARSREFLKRQS
jgi:hypothetical protein